MGDDKKLDSGTEGLLGDICSTLLTLLVNQGSDLGLMVAKDKGAGSVSGVVVVATGAAAKKLIEAVRLIESQIPGAQTVKEG
jgi:hypothetical protein